MMILSIILIKQCRFDQNLKVQTVQLIYKLYVSGKQTEQIQLNPEKNQTETLIHC